MDNWTFAIPPWAFAAAGFLLGAIAGSFVAAILARWPEGRTILRGRSRCDACDSTLGALDLLPLLSFLVLRGRCRRCGTVIDRTLFAIELVAALMGAIAFALAPGPAGVVSAIFGWWLLLLAALDAEHHWLPDRLTLPLLPLGIAAALAGIGPEFDERAIGAVAGFAILASVAWSYQRVRGREGLGGGDPKLLAAIGAWLGWQQLPLVLLGAGLAGLAAVGLARLRGATVRGHDRLPLGTLMALAAWPLWLILVADP